jgi:O-antigen/teichoic acid export membrane protein
LKKTMMRASAIPELSTSATEAPRSEVLLSPPGAGISLRSNVQWTLIGNVIYAACQWAILIVLAKLASPESVGQFALGLAVTAPVMLFANLQLSALQATDARREYRFGHYLALRLLTTVLALAVIAALIWGIGYNPVTAAVVLAVGVAKAFESLSDVYHGLMQQHRRMERVAWSLILKGILSVAAVVAWLYFGGGIIGAACVLTLTWGMLLVMYDLRSTAWLQRMEAISGADGFAPSWEWPMLRKLAWQALPIGIRVMLFTLCLNIPRYFVEQYHGEEALGIFAALAYVTVICHVLSNSLAGAAAPRLASLYAAGDMHGFRSLVFKLSAAGTALGGIGVVLCMIAGRPILTLLYKPEYAEHAGAFTWIMVGAGLWCVASMFVVSANAARRQGSQAIAGIVVTIATLWASAVLIRSDSLGGAAMASVISSAVALVAFGVIFLTIRHRTAIEPAQLDEENSEVA